VKTASGGETSVSGPDNSAQILSYTPGLEEVFLNGVLLTRGVDYTADSGISITSLAPLTNGDEVTVLGWTPFNILGSIDGSNLVDGTVSASKLSADAVANSNVANNAAIASTKLQFIQSGLQATPRTVQNKLREYISVKDFGAVGDGVADDTAAIQAAYNHQSARLKTSFALTNERADTLPGIFFPSGIYIISSPINIPNNGETFGEQAILKKAQSFTGAAGFQRTSGAFRLYFEGLQFVDFPTGLYLDSSNINSGKISVIRCGFFGNTENAVYLNVQSSVTNFNDCIWRSNKHDLFIDSGDQVNVWGGWIQRKGGQLTDDYDGAIVNKGILRMFGTLCVPQPETILEPCWIKNYRAVACLGVRFGDEAAGFTSVNNFSAGSPDTQGRRAFVILKDCEMVSSHTGAAIRLFELPTLISLEDNIGFQQAGGIAINWSSSIDTLAQDAIIANARSGFGLGTRFYIYARNVNDQSIASNLLEFVSDNSRLRLAGRNGTAMRVEYNNAIIPAGSNYFSLNVAGYDASAQAAGLRAQVRVSATDNFGGTETIFSNTGGSSTTLIDVAKTTPAGLLAGADNLQTLGSATNRWSEVFAVTGVINSSDKRDKQDIEELSEAELRVAASLKSLIKKFRFKDAFQQKGDDARVHIGIIVQEVITAFEAEGLDPMRYGIICYDKWDAELNEDGKEVKSAGDRYSVRYEELLAFIISAI
jgi:hypothetical protein